MMWTGTQVAIRPLALSCRATLVLPHAGQVLGGEFMASSMRCSYDDGLATFREDVVTKVTVFGRLDVRHDPPRYFPHEKSVLPYAP